VLGWNANFKSQYKQTFLERGHV